MLGLLEFVPIESHADCGRLRQLLGDHLVRKYELSSPEGCEIANNVFHIKLWSRIRLVSGSSVQTAAVYWKLYDREKRKEEYRNSI